MNKGALDSLHFRRRTGMHSLTGRASGWTEVLPKSARVLEFQRRTIKSIQDNLETEAARWKIEIKRHTKGSPEWQVATDNYCIIAGKLGMWRKEFPLLRSRTWAEIFAFTAQLFLNQESFYHIRDMTFFLIKEMQCKCGKYDLLDPEPEYQI